MKTEQVLKGNEGLESKSWNIKLFSRATKESQGEGEGVLGGDTEEEYLLSTLQD